MPFFVTHTHTHTACSCLPSPDVVGRQHKRKGARFIKGRSTRDEKKKEKASPHTYMSLHQPISFPFLCCICCLLAAAVCVNSCRSLVPLVLSHHYQHALTRHAAHTCDDVLCVSIDRLPPPADHDAYLCLEWPLPGLSVVQTSVLLNPPPRIPKHPTPFLLSRAAHRAARGEICEGLAATSGLGDGDARVAELADEGVAGAI